jgi:hypothetical protein
VRAWRAGYAHILLDGFDEIAPSNLAGGVLENERAARYTSVELVRRFVKETPVESGVLIAGRRNFFYNLTDLEKALGLTGTHVALSVADFTDEQVASYLERQGWDAIIPDWLPRRPLLLGYLASQNVLPEFVEENSMSAPDGWDLLLTKTFEREADIEGGIDGENVRRIFESLATKARSTGSGLGPIFFEDARQAFREVMGFAPNTRHEVVLRRLPWLSVDDPQTESRSFVDEVLADVARAGDVLRFIYDPYSFSLSSDGWLQLL